MITFDGPLDQHFIRHPEDLFGRPIESAQVGGGEGRGWGGVLEVKGGGGKGAAWGEKQG